MEPSRTDLGKEEIVGRILRLPIAVSPPAVDGALKPQRTGVQIARADLCVAGQLRLRRGRGQEDDEQRGQGQEPQRRRDSAEHALRVAERSNVHSCPPSYESAGVPPNQLYLNWNAARCSVPSASCSDRYRHVPAHAFSGLPDVGVLAARRVIRQPALARSCRRLQVVARIHGIAVQGPGRGVTFLDHLQALVPAQAELQRHGAPRLDHVQHRVGLDRGEEALEVVGRGLGRARPRSARSPARHRSCPSSTLRLVGDRARMAAQPRANLLELARPARA